MPGHDPCPSCIRFPGMTRRKDVLKVLQVLKASVGSAALAAVQVEFRSQRVKFQGAKQLRKDGLTFEMGRPQRKRTVRK